MMQRKVLWWPFLLLCPGAALATTTLALSIETVLSGSPHLDIATLIFMFMIMTTAATTGAIGAALFLVPALAFASLAWPRPAVFALAGAAAGALHSWAAITSLHYVRWEEFGPQLSGAQWWRGYALMAYAKHAGAGSHQVVMVLFAAMTAGALAGLVYDHLRRLSLIDP